MNTSFRALVRASVLEALDGFPGGTPEEIAELAAGFVCDDLKAAILEAYGTKEGNIIAAEIDQAAEWAGWHLA